MRDPARAPKSFASLAEIIAQQELEPRVHSGAMDCSEYERGIYENCSLTPRTVFDVVPSVGHYYRAVEIFERRRKI